MEVKPELKLNFDTSLTPFYLIHNPYQSDESVSILRDKGLKKKFV